MSDLLRIISFFTIIISGDFSSDRRTFFLQHTKEAHPELMKNTSQQILPCSVEGCDYVGKYSAAHMISHTGVWKTCKVCNVYRSDRKTAFVVHERECQQSGTTGGTTGNKIKKGPGSRGKYKPRKKKGTRTDLGIRRKKGRKGKKRESGSSRSSPAYKRQRTTTKEEEEDEEEEEVESVEGGFLITARRMAHTLMSKQQKKQKRAAEEEDSDDKDDSDDEEESDSEESEEESDSDESEEESEEESDSDDENDSHFLEMQRLKSYVKILKEALGEAGVPIPIEPGDEETVGGVGEAAGGIIDVGVVKEEVEKPTDMQTGSLKSTCTFGTEIEINDKGVESARV